MQCTLDGLGPSSGENFLKTFETLVKSLLDCYHSLSVNDATLDFPSLSSSGLHLCVCKLCSVLLGDVLMLLTPIKKVWWLRIRELSYACSSYIAELLSLVRAILQNANIEGISDI